MTKPPVIAILAPGEMGAGIGRRLIGWGAQAVVCLDGRSEASLARARAAGMRDVPEAAYADADMILSIVPPGDALAIAERLAPMLEAAVNKPLYVDCNAVSPETVRGIAAVVEGAGAPFADAGIIGNPPQSGGYTPVIYASGAQAGRFAQLGNHGLDIRVMDGGPGQASALKMCYAGLTKGLHAVGASVILGAIEAGVAEPFLKELAESQPKLLDYFTARTPGVFGKAYRWVAEMEEIGGFLEGGGETLYHGAAQQFARLAADHEGPRADEAAIKAFLEGRG